MRLMIWFLVTETNRSIFLFPFPLLSLFVSDVKSALRLKAQLVCKGPPSAKVKSFPPSALLLVCFSFCSPSLLLNGNLHCWVRRRQQNTKQCFNSLDEKKKACGKHFRQKHKIHTRAHTQTRTMAKRIFIIWFTLYFLWENGHDTNTREDFVCVCRCVHMCVRRDEKSYYLLPSWELASCQSLRVPATQGHSDGNKNLEICIVYSYWSCV